MARLTLELTDKVYEKLKNLAKQESIDEVEVIRHALGLYEYSHNSVVGQNRKLAITDAQNKVIENIVFD